MNGLSIRSNEDILTKFVSYVDMRYELPLEQSNHNEA